MSKILVTGASGHIGSNIVQELSRQGRDVRADVAGHIVKREQRGDHIKFPCATGLRFRGPAGPDRREDGGRQKKSSDGCQKQFIFHKTFPPQRAGYGKNLCGKNF